MLTGRLHWGNANGNRHNYSSTQMTKITVQVTYPVCGSSLWDIGLSVGALPMTAFRSPVFGLMEIFAKSA